MVEETVPKDDTEVTELSPLTKLTTQPKITNALKATELIRNWEREGEV